MSLIAGLFFDYNNSKMWLDVHAVWEVIHLDEVRVD